jgi:hypothetical protein
VLGLLPGFVWGQYEQPLHAAPSQSPLPHPQPPHPKPYLGRGQAVMAQVGDNGCQMKQFPVQSHQNFAGVGYPKQGVRQLIAKANEVGPEAHLLSQVLLQGRLVAVVAQPIAGEIRGGGPA